VIAGQAPDNWTVSTVRESGAFTMWGVYRNGRLILSGYELAEHARWARTFLERGELPPGTPENLHALIYARLAR